MYKKEQGEKGAAKTAAPAAARRKPAGDSRAPVGMPLYLERDVRQSTNPESCQPHIEDFDAPGQPTLEVSQPHDPFEQEADRFAELIANSQAAPALSSNAGPALVQRKCAACEAGGEQAAGDCPVCGPRAPLQRKEEATTAGQPDSPPSTVLEDAWGNSGHALAPADLAFFDAASGYDFGQVRIHTDAPAAESARALNAQAYTRGQDIYFKSGLYQPDTSQGRRLLAHELAHTIQQGLRGPARANGAGLSRPLPIGQAASEGVARKAGGDDFFNAGPQASCAIQRQPEPTPTSPPPAAAQGGQETAASVAEAQRIADRIYEALDGWNDEMAAIRAMYGHDAYTRQLIQDRFLASYGWNLRDYLKDQLDGDWVVRAYALLRSSNFHEQHTAMALALIPVGTRDAEVFRILEGLPLEGRHELERRYNETFGEQGNGAQKLGTGSLKGDLKDDLSGWRREKSLALLDRILTSADELYFESVGITGTETTSVINRIQSEWDQGTRAFAVLERDWDLLVRNQSHWTDETWTSLSLDAAMDEELSGESRELVRAVLHGYDTYKKGVSAELGRSLTGEELAAHEQEVAGQPVSEAATFARENIELQVAEDTLTAAVTGLGTNNDQVYRAVSTIRRVWQQRMERARAAGNEPQARDYKRQWEDRRAQLMSSIPDDMETDTVEYRRVRLLTYGDLTPADELYLAGQGTDTDQVVTLLTSFWAQEKINQLLAQAGKPRLVYAPANAQLGAASAGEIIRPTFDPLFTVPVTSGLPFRRVMAMTLQNAGDAGRGAQRLKLELDEGDNDSDLQRAYEFLNTTGGSPGLRDSVIQAFEIAYLRNEPDAPHPQKFLNYISQRYENSNAYWNFRDLLQPATDPTELLVRSRGRQAAAHTGLLDAALSGLVLDYDLITGEDTGELVEESQQRLQFIAHNSEANPLELQAMMAMTGAHSPEELAGMEYQAFRERLEELRELQRSIAEAVATAVQLVIEIALTVVTAGAYGPMLLASLAATVAAIATRELLLGQDYDTVSRENVQQLALAVASHGFGAAGRGAVSKVISPETIKKLGQAGAFIENAVAEGFTQLGTQTLMTAFDGRMPTVESIGATALSIAGSSVGAGYQGKLTHSLTEQTPNITRLRTLVVSNAAQNVISGVTDEGANMVRSGVANISAGDIALNIGRRAGEGIVHGVAGGIGDFGAQHVATGRQRHGTGAHDSDEQMEDVAHHPNKLPDGQTSVTAHPATQTQKRRILATVRVNDAHTLSVVRHPDGTISITICSNNCGRIRQLLLGAKHDHAAQPTHPIHSQLRPLLDAVAEIEAQLRVNPQDEQADRRLQELAQHVSELLGRVGDHTLFGPRDDENPAPPNEEQTGTTNKPATVGATTGQTQQLTVPQRLARSLEVVEQTAANDESARRGLDNLKQVFRSNKSLGEIFLSLVEDTPEQLLPFMRVLRDPAFTPKRMNQLGRRGLVALVDNADALTFLHTFGGEALFHLHYHFGWDSAVLADATARINSAQTPEARAQLIQDLLAANTPLRLRRFLTPPPPLVPLPTATATNMGIDRDHPDWHGFLTEVTEFAHAHNQQGVSHEQLLIRADLAMVLTRARNGDLEALTSEQKRGVLNRYDELAQQERQLAIAAGNPQLAMAFQWINARRGNLAEYMFISREQRSLGKPAFLGGQQVAPGESREGSTIPDYTTTESGVTERVNMKSDLIDRGDRQLGGFFQNGLRAANVYRNWATRAAAQLPTGDRLSVHFIHDPDNPTRLRMLQTLFGGKSPIHRVKFGDTWYTRADLPKGANLP